MMLIEELGEVAEPLGGGFEPALAPMQVQVGSAANAAVIVAHPDDETLWAGGFILSNPHTNWFIATLCRKSDPDRSKKFSLALQSYGAMGAMGDLDDSPEQPHLAQAEVQQAILGLLPPISYDFILSHAPKGEYTRHRRHEEVSQAVMELWQSGALSARELRLFAYEDDHGQHLPQAIKTAHQFEVLTESTWREKYRLITEVYGFSPESWEARGMPVCEAFWRFRSVADLQGWLAESGQVA